MVSYTHTREYTEIHPLIKALFAAKQDVTWQYITAVGIKEIAGTQTLELIIKQPANASSEWIASFPYVKVVWRGRIVKLKSRLTGKRLPNIEPKFEKLQGTIRSKYIGIQ